MNPQYQTTLNIPNCSRKRYVLASYILSEGHVFVIIPIEYNSTCIVKKICTSSLYIEFLVYWVKDMFFSHTRQIQFNLYNGPNKDITSLFVPIKKVCIIWNIINTKVPVCRCYRQNVSKNYVFIFLFIEKLWNSITFLP